MVNLPNFLIVGAAKSGTTSLHYYLKQHPDIFMSGIKEPEFFRSQFSRSSQIKIQWLKKNTVDTFEDYCSLFEGSSGSKAIGESSISNLYYHDKAIKYIKQYLGDPKIIIILRNPVERAFSAYTFLSWLGKEQLSFEEALDREDMRKKENFPYIWLYKAAGFYYAQVKAYMDNFSNVKIRLFDDLKKDPASLLQNVYEFLGVDSSFIPNTNYRYNASAIPRFRLVNKFFLKPPGMLRYAVRGIGEFFLKEHGWKIFREKLRYKILKKSKRLKAGTERTLYNLFTEDIRKLQILIGRDLSHWQKSIL